MTVELSSSDAIAWKGDRRDGNTDMDDKLLALESTFSFKQGEGSKLGTMKGVFIPTLQNILGIILFLRLPWITGQAGIGASLLIVLLGCSASFLTAISVSAVATNGKPKGGGAFSIIKESIGPEFGGTVGCLLFLSNTFGIAMYVLGCVEILRDWVMPGADARLLGVIVLGALFAVVFVGISYISKASMLFMAGVLLSVASIYAGVIEHAVDPEPSVGIVGLSSSQLAKNWGPDYGSGYSFGVMLAIFFPAVTDPLAGSNLSGDLANPQASIPPGTIAAVAVTTVIFVLQVIFTGGSCDRDALIGDRLIVTRLAWPVEELIYVGMLMSTLGAGLQSLAGAPRLLAAIGRDGLVPEFRVFAPAEGAEPRAAVAFIAFLSCCCVMLGSLNAVAPFITMWFLTCYGIINGSCAYLAYEDIPSFRPTFRYYDWRVSLVGAIQCFGMMFFCAPNWYYAVLACMVSVGIYKYIERQVSIQESGQPQTALCASCFGGGAAAGGGGDEEAGGGDASGGGGGGDDSKTDWRAGRRFMTARESLLALRQGDLDFKYWRPFILFLAKTSPEDGTYVPQDGMIHLIQQLMKKGKGLAVVGGVVVGTFEEKHDFVDTATQKLQLAMDERGVEGFPAMVCASSRYEGYKMLASAAGQLGMLKPNTVMLGWPTDLPSSGRTSASSATNGSADEYVSVLKHVALAKKTLLICKGGVPFPASKEDMVGSVVDGANSGVVGYMKGTIDVWWIFDLFPSKGLMLLLPYLLQQHRVWKNCSTRLFAVAAPSTDLNQLKTLLTTFIQAGGIVAQVEVLSMDAADAPRFTDNTNLQGKRTDALAEEISGLTSAGSFNETEGEGHVRGTGEVAAVPSGSGSVAMGGGLTSLLAKHSGDSPLVIMTLPKKREEGQSAEQYLKSVGELVAPLQRCIFVQESGHEKIKFSPEF